MKQVIFIISCICMAAAVCRQFMDGSRYFPALRLVLGTEIAAIAVTAILGAWNLMNG